MGWSSSPRDPSWDEDPGDLEDRLAHGFTAEDDWMDETITCRNGCGLTYRDVVGGKIRRCAVTAEVEWEKATSQKRHYRFIAAVAAAIRAASPQVDEAGDCPCCTDVCLEDFDSPPIHWMSISEGVITEVYGNVEELARVAVDAIERQQSVSVVAAVEAAILDVHQRYRTEAEVIRDLPS